MDENETYFDKLNEEIEALKTALEEEKATKVLPAPAMSEAEKEEIRRSIVEEQEARFEKEIEKEIKEAENKTIYTRTGADKINEAENKAIYFAITSMYFNLKGSKTDDVSEYTKILDAIKNNSGFVLKADAYLQVSLEYLNEIEKMLDDESKKEKIKEYIEWITKRKDK